MPNSSRRRTIIIVLVLLLLIAIVLLLTQCPKKKPAVATPGPATVPSAPVVSPGGKPPAADERAEVLTPATLTAPARVTAGARFSVPWTGPDNPGDYLTIVRTDAPASMAGNYRVTQEGKTLELTAPIEPGAHEVRYVTARSHTILARAPVEVVAAGATLEAAGEVVLGAPLSVAWTGPNNAGDYVTIVRKDAPDEEYGDYVTTDKGSPLTLAAPTVPGDAEVRYVAAQGRKVLARRAIKILTAEVTLSAPGEVIAGTTIDVVWTGPKNTGDYITVVPRETPDGEYGNYTDVSNGSPLKLVMPIMAGDAELRYMTSQGHRVLGRRAIKVVAAKVTLAAAPECKADSEVEITWTGPNNASDYITVVPKGTPDGEYRAYTYTSNGSPLKVKVPKEAGDAEIRYRTGQGNKVLVRIALKIVP